TLHHARPSRTGASPRPAPSVSRSLRTIEAVRPATQIPNVGSVPPVPNLGAAVIGSRNANGPSPHVRAKRQRRRAEILRAALRAFRRADARVAAFAILGALNGISRWYRPDGPFGARALGDQFATLLIDGLAGDRIAPRPRAPTAAP